MDKHKMGENICDICGTIFMARLDRIEKGKARYCSQICWHKILSKLGGVAMRKRYPILAASNLRFAPTARKIAEKELPDKPCEICGNPKVDKHHDDYAKPLEVMWLCRRHHIQRHINL
jgi:hypothetical protein